MILIFNLKHYLTNFDDILRNIHVMKHKSQFTIKTNLDHKERDYIIILINYPGKKNIEKFYKAKLYITQILNIKEQV